MATPQLSFRMNNESRQLLDLVCGKRGVDRAAFMRQAILTAVRRELISIADKAGNTEGAEVARSMHMALLEDGPRI